MAAALLLFAGLWLMSSLSSAADGRNLTLEDSRQGKLFPVFQIIKFQNTGCSTGSNSRNGTCYTAHECEELGGTNSGSCASGYGVCCVFSLSCGEKSSQNCTYITETSAASLEDNPCTYEICPCSADICRIKFDFNTFNIAGPQVGTTVDSGTGPTEPVGNGAGIGDCLTDSFSITSPANQGTPSICGINSGHHMFVDANPGTCHLAAFSLGNSGAGMRSWDIKVTQFNCGDTNGGPDGCLEYYTEATGTISSYNFPTGAVTSTATHLSNQRYSICFRRESGFCAICFTRSRQGDTPSQDDQHSFGLSIAAIADTSSVEAGCTSDYIVIRNAVDVPDGMSLDAITAISEAGRICGRMFSSVAGTLVTDGVNLVLLSVCTRSTPFQVEVNFDADEVATGTDQASNEQFDDAGGIIGFSLDYAQIRC